MKARKIDASYLEGGGQLVRLALTLSCLSKRPIELINIRGQRPKPGLREQHLTCIKYLGSVTNAGIEGAAIKSAHVSFIPSKTQVYVPDEITIQTAGAGAVSLVLQAILPFLLFSRNTNSKNEIKLRLKGGTNGHFAPSIDYVRYVLLPNLRLLGFPTNTFGDVTVKRRGWAMGSVTGGEVEFNVKALDPGSKLPAFEIGQRGRLTHIEAVILAPNDKLCGHISTALEKEVLAKLDIEEVTVLANESSGHDKRLYLLVVACTSSGWRLGRDWLYDRKLGKSAEAITGACDTLVKTVVSDLKGELDHGNCLDEWMEDQIVVFQALADGQSTLESKDKDPSLHTQTARWVAGEILGVEFDKFGSCDGVGFAVNSN